MKNMPFILLILGLSFIWLGLTGRLGVVLAAIFEPSYLALTTGGASGAPVVLPEKGSPEDTPSDPAPDEPSTPDTPSVDPPVIPESPTDIFPGEFPMAV